MERSRCRDLERIETSAAKNINTPHDMMAGTSKSLEKTNAGIFSRISAGNEM